MIQKKKTNRLISLALCLCMVLGLLPGIPLLPAAAAGTEGMITVEMTDSYGDGWNGNGIEIYVDDILIATATLDSGAAGKWTTPIDIHVNYVFKWKGGSYPSETSFVIYLGTEVLLSGKGNAYSDGDVLRTQDQVCTGTGYNENFCCDVCGLTCVHASVKERVCEECGFICGTSAPHTWEGGVCTICSAVCGHEDYAGDACALCGGTCGTDYLHSFINSKCSVCGVVCGVEMDHTMEKGACVYCDYVCSHSEALNGFCDDCQYYESAVDADGDGYYEIDNPGKLYWFSDQVANGMQEINGELTKDIRINDRVYDAAGEPLSADSGIRNWIPIGLMDSSYYGKFNGNDHTISGLYYSGTEKHVALFGYIRGATILNVSLADSYLSALDDAYAAGGIVGYMSNSTVENCHNSALVISTGYGSGICANSGENCTIAHCTNAGDIFADDAAGGINGYGNATIKYCENTGDITNTGDYDGVGGISGWDGTISYCNNTGTVSGREYGSIGGIAGITISTISYCSNSGKVICTGKNSKVGLILGACNGPETAISNCWYLLDGSGIADVGASNGHSIETTGATIEQYASGEVCYKLNDGYTYGIWKQTLGTDAGPRFSGKDVYRVYGALCNGNYIKTYSNVNNSVSKMHTDADRNHLCDDCGESASDCRDLIKDHNCDLCGTALTTHVGTATCVSLALCTICGERFGTVDENNHSFNQTGLCTLCDVQAVASVVKTSTDPAQYFMTFEEALAYAAESDQSAVWLHTDVQIDGDVNVAILMIPEGVTVTVNGNLNAGSLEPKGSWAGNGTVVIDATVYKVHNNKLYLLAGEAGADWEIWNVEVPTYWTAGEGYAAFDPETSVLDLHNATIHPEMSSSDDGCVCYDKDLTINFSGVNTLTANDHTVSRVFDIEGTVGMNGIGEGAQLNITGGSTASEVTAAFFSMLNVNAGTVTFTGGNGTASKGLSVAESLYIAEGAVVNAHGGDATTHYSLGVMTEQLTVDGTLNATSGACASGLAGALSADIYGYGITGNGTVNGVFVTMDADNMKVRYTVYGNAVMENDRTVYIEEGVPAVFTVPECTTLTIGEDVTLDLSECQTHHLTFSGTLVNNGTILLPAGVPLTDVPESGVVVIGENSFKWHEEDGWRCSSESQHTGGTATCIQYPVCDLCGKTYGDTDYDNHTGDTYVEYEWYPSEDNTCYAYATLYCSDCKGYLDSTSGECELVENVEAVDCLNSGHLTYLYTCTMGENEYTEIHNVTVFSDNHVGQFENGFCSACGGYEKPDVDPGEDPEWDYDDVYLIENAGQLYWFADYVNNVNNGVAARLTADIDLNPGYTFYADGTYTGGDAPRAWIPIGMGYPCYAGHFDGNNKVISGAYCVSEGTYVGIFGNTDYNYTICNVGVSNSYFVGAGYVGGLIGYAYTIVNNCFTTDTVYVSGEFPLGGLVGYSGGEINNCLALNGSLVDGGSGTCTNCFVLTDAEISEEGITAVTAEQLASGEIAFLLQSGVAGEEIYDEETGEYVTAEPKQIWGQQIGTDPYPILGGAKVYEGYAYCDVIGYTNDPESKPQPHNYVDGVCVPCGKVCAHSEPVDGLCPDCGLKLYKVSLDDRLTIGLEIVEGLYAAEGKDYVGKVVVLPDTVPGSNFLMWLTIGGEYFGNYSMQAGVLEIAGEYVTGDIRFTCDGELYHADVDYTCFDYLMGDLTPVDVQWAGDYTKATFTYTCSFCEETQTRTLNTAAEIITPATCRGEGLLRHSARYGEAVRSIDVVLPVDEDAHDYDETTGNCTLCGEIVAEASVKLDGAVSYYLTLQEALDAAVAGNQQTPAYVTVLKSAKAPTVEVFAPEDDIPGLYEDFWLIKTGEMTVDFNGCTLTGPLKVLGQDGQSVPVVTFADTSAEKNGGVDHITAEGATLIIEGGNIHSDGRTAIDAKNCDLTVNGGVISAVNNSYYAHGIRLNGGSVTVNGGEIHGDYAGIKSYGVTVINGGTITGNHCAISLEGDPTGTEIKGSAIDGGTLSGGSVVLEMDDKHTAKLGIQNETGIGAHFPNGLVVSEGIEAEELLGDHAAYWTPVGMLAPVEGSDISHYGAVTVKKYCNHSENTNMWEVREDGNSHFVVCNICNTMLTGDHVWEPATCETDEFCTVCGAIGGPKFGHQVGEPSCTDPATCSRCGDIIAPALGHEDRDGDGECDFCLYVMPYAELCFTTISLEGNIAINYYMNLNESLLKDCDAYMQFTLANGEVLKIPAIQGIPVEVDGVTYYVFSCAVAAKEMTDNVVSQFFYGDASTTEYTYSVKTYADNILANSDDQEMKALVIAMLRYGAAAQHYFGYNTDNMADVGLEAVDYSGVSIDGYTAPTGRGTDLVFVRCASLLMNTENDLRFYFKADSTVESFSVTCNGQSLDVKRYDDLYYVDVVGIAAKDLDEYVTITIDDGISTADVTYNPMVYCGSIVSAPDGVYSQQMKDLACALYLYNRAANAYFAKAQ